MSGASSSAAADEAETALVGVDDQRTLDGAHQAALQGNVGSAPRLVGGVIKIDDARIKGTVETHLETAGGGRKVGHFQRLGEDVRRHLHGHRSGLIAAIFVGGLGLDNEVAAGAAIAMLDSAGVAIEGLGCAIAPVDFPTADGVLAGIGGGQVEGVGLAALRGSIAGDRQCRRNVADMIWNSARANRPPGSVARTLIRAGAGPSAGVQVSRPVMASINAPPAHYPGYKSGCRPRHPAHAPSASRNYPRLPSVAESIEFPAHR